MKPGDTKQKNANQRNNGKKRQFKQKGRGSYKDRKRRGKDSANNESKVNREIQEITGLQKRIEELSALPEEERKSIKKFSNLPISNYTKRGLTEAGFTEMTDIQQKSLINSILGRDVLGCAKTGSGKTLAFLIPVLEYLYRERWTTDDGLGAVIISPTRELAMQIIPYLYTFDVLCTIGKYHSFSAGLVIGGKDFTEEQDRILNMNILVATPGRFLQHVEQTPGFDCSNIRGLVIDEVDRCLDMGFRSTIDHIVEALNPDRQTQLFSATVDEEVKRLASTMLTNPVSINVTFDDDYATPATLTQRYVVCDLSQKVELLFSFIKSHLRCKTLIFAASRKEVRFLFESFRRLKPGVPLLHLHGKQKQTMRTYTYYDFVQKDHAVLFCTDVAARGIDFPAIDWVVQFDCPEDSATYIHRVGRTGRFRAKGNSLLFLLPEEEKAFLPMMAEANVPLKRIAVNPSRTQSVTNRLMEEVARDEELGHLAAKAFQSYVRSVYLATNKELFDVRRLPLDRFAESLGLGVVPNLKFLKKGKKKVGSYAMQQLQEEMEKEESQKGRQGEGEGEEEASSDEELLQKTGKTTADAPEVEVRIPEKKTKKRFRISPDGEPTGKSIRFDEEGRPVEEDRRVMDVEEVQDEIGEEAAVERVAGAKEQLMKNEERDRVREKQRVREKRLIKKQREKELNRVEEAPVVLLGGGDDENDDDEEEEEIEENEENEENEERSNTEEESESDGESEEEEDSNDDEDSDE